MELLDSEEPLKIGDYVTLRAIGRHGCFLSAEGILDQRVFVQEHPGNFDDCRFQICSPNQYSAARELADWEANILKEQKKNENAGEAFETKSAEEKTMVDINEDDEEEEEQLDEDSANENLRKSMERGKLSERELNTNTMKRETGNPVKFGDNYQLRHVKSGRYLTMSPKEIAKLEKQNMKIYLDEEGNSNSHFTINPKHKIDKSGDPVCSSHHIELMSTENRNKFLNYSQHEVSDMHGHREVNCALNRCTFSLFLYANYKSPGDETLCCSDIVRLRDPEKNALLRLLPLPSSTDGDAEKDKERYDLYLETQSEHSSQESNALWILEARHPHIGGEVEFATTHEDGPLYRLRHLNTGRYISTRFNDNFKKQGGAGRPGSRGGRPPSRGAVNSIETQYLCTTRRLVRSALTEISFANAKTKKQDAGKKPILMNNQPIQLCINNKFLAIGPKHEELQQRFAEQGEYLYMCGAAEDKTDAVLSLNIERSDDASTVIDALCGVCALPHIQTFANLVKKKQIKQIVFEIENDFRDLMASLVNYLRGDPLSKPVDFKKREKILPTPQSIQPDKQIYLREQAVLTEILDICKLLMDDFWKQYAEIKVDIAKMCFAVLLNAIANNSANQMHVADRLPIFIGHVSTHYLATRCIVEMLEKNKELQEDKVNDEAVAKFIDMIRTGKMKGEYLNLLKAVCSCKGKGVDDNQCMVAEQWLTEARDLQITIESDNKKIIEKITLFNESWVPLEHRQKGVTQGNEVIAGFEILKQGVPPIKASWMHEDRLFEPNALGGAMNKMPIELLLSSRALHDLGSMTSTAVRYKKRVADYFVAQLNLAAEVCLDRNYVAIMLCEVTLPFSDLFAILKTPDLDEALYAAVVRVITCVYVDRNPQTVLRVPRLSRILKDEPKLESELMMPAVSDERKYYFALLQDTLEEELSLIETKFDNQEGTEKDFRMMQLLKKLVQFRFYSDPADNTKLIQPLVGSLDQRASALTFNRLGTASSSRTNTANSLTRTSSRNSMTPLTTKSAPVVPITDLEGGSMTSSMDGDKGVQFLYPDPNFPNCMRLYDFLDHIGFVIFVIVLTCVGIILSFIFGTEGPAAWPAIEMGISVFFLVELIARMYCYTKAKGPLGTPLATLEIWKNDFVMSNPPLFFHDGYAATDFWVVALDVVSIVVMESGIIASAFNPGTVARGGRIMRILKISKMLKAARFVGKVKDMKKTIDISEWVLPARYANTGQLKMKTMLETVDVLREITQSNRDFAVSLLLNKWQKWDVAREDKTPEQLFDECYEELKGTYNLSLDSNMEEFDLVFLDLCLYKYPDLVQSALNVLMIHHNLRADMLEDISHSQLLVRSEDEETARELIGKLEDLQSSAEQAELWAELKTSEDNAINEKVKGILRYLASRCRIKTSKLNGTQLYRPAAKYQNLLRNLGVFEVAMTVLELEASLGDEDDEDEGSKDPREIDVQENTREILRLCNIFLSWFVKHNPKNQELAFGRLDVFTDYLSGGFGASKVVSEIFRGNEKLVKQFPPKLYTQCADLLVTEMNPDILDVFEALMWMPTHDAPNNYQVQQNIFKVLTDTNRWDSIKYLCEKPDSDEYNERKRFCQDATRNLQALPADGSGAEDEYAHMPNLLTYHVKLLQVLSGTAIGRVSITEIEARLQTEYSENDLCAALLDPDSTLDILLPIGQFLYFAIIEVEIAVSGLGKNKLMWRFLQQCVQIFREIIPSLEFLQTNYRDVTPDAVAARRKVLYALTCAQIVGGFFEKYYKPDQMEETFTLEDTPTPEPGINGDARLSPGLDSQADNDEDEDDGGGTEAGASVFGPHVHMWWHDTIAELQAGLANMYAFQSKVMTVDHYKILFESIDQCVMAMDDDTKSNLNIARPDDLESVCESVEASMQELGEEVEEPEKAVSYNNFVDFIRNSEKIKESIVDDKKHMVESLGAIPSFTDPDIKDDLRMEPLIQKLVDHTRSRLVFDSEHSKFLDPDCTRSTKWFITLFRMMIEEKWGCDIDDRDEEGTEEHDDNAYPTQMMLNQYGATSLCLDLISAGIDADLVLECIKLLVALLFREGGATEVQTTIFKHLNKGRSELFFEEMEDIIDKMMKYYKNTKDLPGIEIEDAPSALTGEIIIAEMPQNPPVSDKEDGDGTADGGEEDDDLPDPVEDIPMIRDNIIAVRFMQLLCEGHYEPNQDLLRHQKNNARPINTLSKMVKFMQELSKSEKQCRASTKAATALGDLILEVIQGPCVGNQEFFADSELIEILNRVMRNKPTNDCDDDEEDDLKAICLNILEALCEGQLQGSKIYERILSVIDLEVLRVMILSGDSEEGSLNECQTEALVLLQMFFDYQPSLREEVKLPPRVQAMMGRDVTSVEVIWHSQLQRRFFSKPSICNNLAKATRDDLVVHVVRSSAEEQLNDFVSKVKDVYLELLWQDTLQKCTLSSIGNLWKEFFEKRSFEYTASYGTAFSKFIEDRGWDINLATVFSRQSQKNATNYAFFVASAINLIMLLTFKKIPITAEEAFGPNGYDPRDDYTDDQASTWIGFRYGEGWKVLPLAPEKEGGSMFEGHRLPTDKTWVVQLLQVMNIFNISLSSFTLILFLVVRVPVKYKSLVAKNESHMKALLIACTDFMTLYYFGYTFIALLATIHSPVWQGVLLLDIIAKDTTTQAVLLAVVKPGQQLIMTFLLAFFVIYIFAFWVFVMFPDDFSAGHKGCRTLGQCVITSFDYGIRLSGGIGDIMSVDIENRWVMDVLYFILVLVILLNVVFGIIIDTFSELRSEKIERLRKTTQFCFICGIEKLRFDRNSDGATGFQDHIKDDHHMWDYLAFIVFIWEQDKDDDDGLEYYVRDLVEKEDIKWFPMNKAMVFSSSAKEEETVNEKIESAEKSLQNVVTEQTLALKETLDETTMMMKHMINQLNEKITNIEENGVKSKGGGGNGGSGGGQQSGGNEIEPSFKVAVPVSQAAPVPSQAVLVQVVDALDLVKPHLLGSTDPFVSVSILWNGSKVGDSETIWFGTENPQWKNEVRNTFTIPISGVESIASSILVAEVYHAHRRGAGHFLGAVQISGSDLMTYDGQKQYFRLGKKERLGASKQAMVQGSLGLLVKIKNS